MISDPFGLPSWSSHNGTWEHAAAIQMAAMLTGVAGPIVILDDGEIPRPMNPLVPVLVAKGGRRPRSLDILRSVPMEMDAQLRRRFASFSPEGMREAYLMLSKTRGRYREEPSHADRLIQMCEMLEQGEEMGASDPYSADWQPDALDRRLRTVLRPGFVIENTSTSKLQDLVAGCHDSTARLPGFPLAYLLRGGERAFEEFFSLVAGRDLELPGRVIGNSLAQSERGEIRCILTADPSEIAGAVETFPGFANRVVLVNAGRPPAPSSWDEQKVATFQHLFDRQAQMLTSKRRLGHYVEFQPWSPEGRRVRLDNQDAFLRACDAAEVSCTGLEDLPAVLRWAFDLITPTGTSAHEEVAAIIHRLCLALLDDHVRLLGAAQRRATRARQLELAEKLVRRISAKQPVRQRDLIRTFDNQKVERYRPVLDLLVEEGVLVEEPLNVFRLGTRQLESVRSRWLGDPVLLS